MEGPTCIGCNHVIEEGSVIAFGDSLFHLKCFVCAKCSDPVDCESNLLLLANGRPVCEGCSYCCDACKQVISDEAIMTGDKAYHADCFRCVSCKNKIDDLIFTQTSKGIHCTSCHEKRRAEKQKRRERKLKQQQKDSSAETSPQQISPRPLNNKRNDPPTPSRSRNNSGENPPKLRLITDSLATPPKPKVGLSITTNLKSNNNISPNSPPLSINNTKTSTFEDMPTLNFSFFDNDSSDLINLTKKLGANISVDKLEDKTTENITRASQLLETSLYEEDYDSFPQPPQFLNNGEIDRLKVELENANSKLIALQTSYNKIKDASRKALEELSRAKEECSKESSLRQQQEFIILQLRHQLQLSYQAKSMSRIELSVITREEIERVANIRTELNKSCIELRGYRDTLAKDIESLALQKQAGLEVEYKATSHLELQQKALVCELKSLQSERDQLQRDNKAIEITKDEILHEMVMLNTKNAELTEMNNNLSRRVTEREREAAAVMAGTSFLPYSPSSSLSSEIISPILRKSPGESPTYQQQPKMFKLKKKPNMFSKLSGKSKDPMVQMYGQQNSPISNTTSSLNLNMSSTTTNLNLMAGSNEALKGKQIEQQHGSHTFLQTSYLRPTKCDGCGEKMWGLSELRCQGCSINTHARCLSQISQSCNSSQQQKLFGGDLSERAKFEDRPIPLIIEKCIAVVEKRGMDYEGIYRKSGGAAQVRTIIQTFEDPDNSESIDLDGEECDICSVTSVLKQYFRDLSDPLLPFHLYSQFIDAVSNQINQNTKSTFIELLSQLPKANYDTLTFLIKHLNSVQQRHDENLMTTKNLAMVFGPTLLRDKEATRDLIDMSHKNAVVEYLILNANELLP